MTPALHWAHGNPCSIDFCHCHLLGSMPSRMCPPSGGRCDLRFLWQYTVRSPETGEADCVLLSRVRAVEEILAIAESLFRNSLVGGLKIIEYPVKLVLQIVEPVLN